MVFYYSISFNRLLIVGIIVICFLCCVFIDFSLSGMTHQHVHPSQHTVSGMSFQYQQQGGFDQSMMSHVNPQGSYTWPPQYPSPPVQFHTYDSPTVEDSTENIKTLYVTGLPYDATDRELYLLFGSCKGFDKSMIVSEGNGNRPYGFVSFETVKDAKMAAQRLSGFQFDPVDITKLKLQLSKKNTPDWFNTSCASPASVCRRFMSMPVKPKTIYVSKIPTTITKDLFEYLVATSFAATATGVRYTPTEKKMSYAFIGFKDHDGAREAIDILDGRVLTHQGITSTLSASFAITEWDPKSKK